MRKLELPLEPREVGKIQEARRVGTDFLALAQNRPAMQQDAAAIQVSCNN